MVIILNKSKRNKNLLHVETIILFELGNIITKYEKKLFTCLQKREYEACENILSDFCYDLLDLSDEEQVHVARVFFTSIITEIIKVQARKECLHPISLSNAYGMIFKLEKWRNITEYLLYIPEFIECLHSEIISEPLVFIGNPHVESALQLIHKHIKDSYLNVNWLAEQLDISTTHLSNLFKIHVGEAVSRYIAKRKVDEIAYDIVHTNKSLKAIREKYGFRNHSHFIQYFKKQKGITPLQYIRAHLR